MTDVLIGIGLTAVIIAAAAMLLHGDMEKRRALKWTGGIALVVALITAKVMGFETANR